MDYKTMSLSIYYREDASASPRITRGERQEPCSGSADRVLWMGRPVFKEALALFSEGVRSSGKPAKKKGPAMGSGFRVCHYISGKSSEM